MHPCFSVTSAFSLADHSIVVVDAGLAPLSALIHALPVGGQVHVLDQPERAVAQLADILAANPGCQALHLISHGAPGAILLGQQVICSDNLAQHAEALARLRAAMAPDAEWFIYGCEVAQGDTGRALVQALQAHTGLTIAASTQRVGHAQLGGQWQLDVLPAGMQRAPLVAEGWPGVLGEVPTVDLDGDLTEAFSRTVSFDPAPNAIRFTVEETTNVSSGEVFSALVLVYDPLIFPDGGEESLTLLGTNPESVEISVKNLGSPSITVGYNIFNAGEGLEFQYKTEEEKDMVGLPTGKIKITFKGHKEDLSDFMNPRLDESLTAQEVEFLLDAMTYGNTLLGGPTGGDRVFNIQLYEEGEDPAFVPPLSTTTFTVTFGEDEPEDTIPPVFQSAATSTDGLKVILTYDEPLSATTAPTSSFSVWVDGVQRAVTSVSTQGSTVELTLASAVTPGQVVEFEYLETGVIDDAEATQDLAGNDAATLFRTAVSNSVPDTVPPVLLSAATSANGEQIILTYNEVLDTLNPAAAGAFTVMVDGEPVAVTQVFSPFPPGDFVRLTLASAVNGSQTVTVAYTDPTADDDPAATQDRVGNDAPSFAPMAVTNNAPLPLTVDLNGEIAGSDRSVVFDATPDAMTFTAENSVNALGGALFGIAPNQTEWFGKLQVRFNLNDFKDGIAESLSLKGSAQAFLTDLGATTALPTTRLDIGDNSFNVSIVVEDGVATISFVARGTDNQLSAAQVEFLLDSLVYGNTATEPQGGDREFTIRLFDYLNTKSDTASFTVTFPDETPPVLLSAETTEDGASIILTYDEDLDSEHPPMGEDFVVTVNGEPREVASVTVVGTTVVLGFEPALEHGDEITVSYTDPTDEDDSLATQDMAGNDAASLADQAVTNRVPDTTPPVLLTAETSEDGASIILTYDETLNDKNPASLTDFTVTVNGEPREVASVTVVGATVVLGFEPALEYGDEVTVSYTDPTDDNDVKATQDRAGNDAGDLVNQAVTNRMPVPLTVDLNGEGNGVDRTLVFDPAAEMSFTVGETTNALGGKLFGEGTDPTEWFGELHIRFALADFKDGANESLRLDGSQEAFLTNLSTVSNLPLTVLNAGGFVFDVRIIVADGEATIIFTTQEGAGVSAAQAEYLLDALRYSNDATTPAAGDRVFGVTLFDSTNTESASARFTVEFPDVTPPVLLSAETTEDGASIILTYDEDLDSEHPPMGEDFVVTVNGEPREVASVTVVGTTVVLGFEPALEHGDEITVSYTDPTDEDDSLATQDMAGNDAASLADQAVTNRVPDTTPPVLLTAETSEDGASIILTYDETLNDKNPASLTDFIVTVNGAPREVASVTVVGATVVLGFEPALEHGDEITVSYTDPTDEDDSLATQDMAGNDAASLADQAVTNRVPDTTPPVPPVPPVPPMPPITIDNLPPLDQWSALPDDDGDGTPEVIEALVPGWVRPDGSVAAVGDGNGDGVPDRDQTDVASVPFRDTALVTQDPTAPVVFVTLVGGSDAAAAPNGSVALSNVRQLDAPPVGVGLGARPADLQLPLGLIAFTATTTTPGEATTFTLLVDGDLAINGYWKQNPETGEWVNLATAVVVEGSRTRLDFSIEDNGVFDTNPALGVIDDPGGIGFMVVLPPSQLGCPWDPFQPDADRDGIPDAVEASLGLNPLVKDNDIFGNGELFVQQLYRDLLGREGETEGVAYWVDALAGGQSRADLVVGFMALPEFEAHAGAIVRLYHAVLDRSPDFCGFNYWMQQALNGLTGKDLAAAFLHQAEYLNDASGMSDAGFVAMLYDHALQRPADDAGTTYWLAQLGQGMTRAEMLHHVAQSGEARAALADEVTIDMLYLGLLDRAADAGGWNHWHRAWSQFEDVAGFIGSASAMPEYVDRFLAEAELTGQRLETDA